MKHYHPMFSLCQIAYQFRVNNWWIPPLSIFVVFSCVLLVHSHSFFPFLSLCMSPFPYTPFPHFHLSNYLLLSFPSSILPFITQLFSLSSPPFPPPLSFSVFPPDPPESFDFKPLCTVKIDDADQLSQLKEAVEDLYYFEFVFGEAFFSDWAMLCTYVCMYVCMCVGCIMRAYSIFVSCVCSLMVVLPFTTATLPFPSLPRRHSCARLHWSPRGRIVSPPSAPDWAVDQSPFYIHLQWKPGEAHCTAR